MKQHFLARGFTLECADEAYDVALSTSRDDLLKKGVKRDKKFSVSCITTYTPKAYMIKNTILKHWHLISNDPSLNRKFKEPPLFVYRQGPNLRNRVVRASIRTVPNQTLLAPLRNVRNPCGNCAHCNNTWKAFDFKHPKSGKPYPVSGVISCNTKNVMYILMCPCDKV